MAAASVAAGGGGRGELAGQHSDADALWAALDMDSAPDGRFSDPHFIARLMHGVSAMIANAAGDPGATADIAQRVAATPRFISAAATLVEDGGNLCFAAPQALALVLSASGATHAAVVGFDGGRVVAGLVGSIAGSKPDPVLQPLVAMVLQALCEGPQRKTAADILAEQVATRRVVCGFFESATCRCAGTSVVSAMLVTEAGRAWCTKHFESLELHTVGSALHTKLIARTGKAGGTTT